MKSAAEEHPIAPQPRFMHAPLTALNTGSSSFISGDSGGYTRVPYLLGTRMALVPLVCPFPREVSFL